MSRVSSAASAADWFATTTVKVTGPPGSAMGLGVALLSTLMEGRTSVISTEAESVRSRGNPTAVMVSVTTSPASPVASATKLHS